MQPCSAVEVDGFGDSNMTWNVSCEGSSRIESHDDTDEIDGNEGNVDNGEKLKSEFWRGIVLVTNEVAVVVDARIRITDSWSPSFRIAACHE